MSDRDDGVPIHPLREVGADGCSYNATTGMSLRDYFAGQALVGQLANQEILNRHGLATENVVKAAYEIADAMLRARKEG